MPNTAHLGTPSLVVHLGSIPEQAPPGPAFHLMHRKAFASGGGNERA